MVNEEKEKQRERKGIMRSNMDGKRKGRKEVQKKEKKRNINGKKRKEANIGKEEGWKACV